MITMKVKCISRMISARLKSNDSQKSYHWWVLEVFAPKFYRNDHLRLASKNFWQAKNLGQWIHCHLPLPIPQPRRLCSVIIQ